MVSGILEEAIVQQDNILTDMLLLVLKYFMKKKISHFWLSYLWDLGTDWASSDIVIRFFRNANF